ncbi:MAG: hypothetical protein IT384_17545 [Deltaproteobacteria bacterium]|nr:hypothetical protein [Deltaproteobacteria bacterium]
MRRVVPAAVFMAVLLFAGPAGAPPPIPNFPASLRPASGNAPFNTKVWAFGDEAPPLAQIGLALVVGGAPVDLSVAAMGCCAVVGTLGNARTGSATAVVTTPGAELRADFTIVGVADSTAPVLTTADLIDASGPRLVIGVLGSDDTALAGFLARVDGEVTGAVSTGYVLEATPGPDGCVSVTPVDLAGNEGAPRVVCAPRPDGGVESDAGRADGGGDADGGGCACAVSGGESDALLGLLWVAIAAGVVSRSKRMARSLAPPRCPRGPASP